MFVDGDVSIDKYQDEASGKTLSAIRIVQSMRSVVEANVDRVSILRNPRPQGEPEEV